MELLELYQLADAEHIPVYSFDLPQTHSLSLMNNDGSCAVAIDPFGLNSTKDEKIRLAHELGHCVTGSFYNRYSDFDIKAKSEYRADKWAIKKLIPKDELQAAFEQGYTEPWDLAEYFNVTEEFIIKAVNLYQLGNI
jgi:hypothetical protein